MSNLQFESPTRLNAVQMHLLELFSREMGDHELVEIKELLLHYYAQKTEDEMARIWEQKGYTKASFKKATRNLHLRGKKQHKSE